MNRWPVQIFIVFQLSILSISSNEAGGTGSAPTNDPFGTIWTDVPDQPHVFGNEFLLNLDQLVPECTGDGRFRPQLELPEFLLPTLYHLPLQQEAFQLNTAMLERFTVLKTQHFLTNDEAKTSITNAERQLRSFCNTTFPAKRSACVREIRKTLDERSEAVQADITSPRKDRHILQCTPNIDSCLREMIDSFTDFENNLGSDLQPCFAELVKDLDQQLAEVREMFHKPQTLMIVLKKIDENLLGMFEAHPIEQKELRRYSVKVANFALGYDQRLNQLTAKVKKCIVDTFEGRRNDQNFLKSGYKNCTELS